MPYYYLLLFPHHQLTTFLLALQVWTTRTKSCRYFPWWKTSLYCTVLVVSLRSSSSITFLQSHCLRWAPKEGSGITLSFNGPGERAVGMARHNRQRKAPAWNWSMQDMPWGARNSQPDLVRWMGLPKSWGSPSDHQANWKDTLYRRKAHFIFLPWLLCFEYLLLLFPFVVLFCYFSFFIFIWIRAGLNVSAFWVSSLKFKV